MRSGTLLMNHIITLYDYIVVDGEYLTSSTQKSVKRSEIPRNNVVNASESVYIL